MSGDVAEKVMYTLVMVCSPWKGYLQSRYIYNTKKTALLLVNTVAHAKGIQ